MNRTVNSAHFKGGTQTAGGGTYLGSFGITKAGLVDNVGVRKTKIVGGDIEQCISNEIKSWNFGELSKSHADLLIQIVVECKFEKIDEFMGNTDYRQTCNAKSMVSSDHKP